MPQLPDSLKFLVQRDGVSQKQRRPFALDPSFVKLDERKLEDFLVFAIEYSKKVNFFSLNNKPEGSWEGFWNSDPTMVIAAITKTNPLPAKLSFEKISSGPPTLQGLDKSIDHILDIAKKIDYWYKNIRRGTSLHIELRRLIEANLSELLIEVASLEKSVDKFITGYKGYNEDNYLGFSSEWDFDLKDNKPEINLNLLIPQPDINKDITYSCSSNLSEAQMLSAAFSIIKDHFTKIYNVYFQIVQLSSTHLEQSLTRADHPPHVALFISFLKLFLQVQNDLNQMTKKHLDFFYREVLGLKPKDAVPDKTHLFFELAKNRLEHSVDGGVRFRAGKDLQGNDLFYALDKTSVLNVAKVESLRTIYLEKPNIADQSKIGGIKAAPVANSEDGKGAPIQDKEKPTWFTMGSSNMPDGKIGFALASHELLLTEGTRTVTITVKTSKDVPIVNEKTFQVFLSGEGEWIPASYSASKLPGQLKGFEITFSLAPDLPQILPFDKDEFEEELGTNLPVVKILINPEKLKNPPTYQDFLDLKIESIALDIEVKGMTQVISFNDDGLQDTGKPFLPFTSVPKKGSSFYTGNSEVFRKNLKKLAIKIYWENSPEEIKEYYAGYGLEDEDGNINFGIKATLIGEKDQLPISFDILNGDSNNHPYILKADEEKLVFNSEITKLISSEKAEIYGLNNKVGFLRLNLLNDFGHTQYQQVLTRQMLAVAMFPSGVIGAWYRDTTRALVKATSTATMKDYEVVIPNPPYTPAIKSISIDYKSNVSGDIQFLHLHPFKNTYQVIEKIENSSLLPQFKNPKSKTEKNILIPQAGALLIGIRDLQPKQSLTLLFQVVENTADAELAKPKVQWYYLKSNEWEPFRESEVVSDTTDELLTAGIVEFAIPNDINKENTILPSDLNWIKAAVSENPEAISHAIDVHAQAAQVTFQNNDNGLSHLVRPLPAETISKLEYDNSAIKGIFQNYDSFGGQPAESDLNFYTRVSEHLRHKGRAITLFDYERLILERFPAIYKVRCVNHTDDTFHLSPGHVVISIVPDFSKLKAVDRMQPKVSLAQLEKIKRFMEERNCAFVGNPTKYNPNKQSSLHVLNPKYEKIRVSFRIRFQPEISSIEFHIEKIKNALIRFMSPWAFEDTSDITFGGKVFKSVLLHFVEKQPYVDYIKDFKMMHNGANEDVNIIESKTPISILVPDTVDTMDITYIDDEECVYDKLLEKRGLGYENLEETRINH